MKATKRHRKESVQSKKWYPSHKFFYVLFSVAQSFLLGFSWSSDSVTASNKKSASKKKYISVNNYIIFAKKYKNSTTLSMWAVYKYISVYRCLKMFKRCLKMWFFTSVDINWYKVKWSSDICKKSSFFSFYSFLVKLSEWHRESVRVKSTKCDKVEWSEKCHYASDIPFEWLHVWFVILLSYYFILGESDFLWKI